MSESCLIIHPAAGNEGMRRGSGMGLNSRGAVSEVNSVRPPEMRSQSSSVERQGPVSPRIHVSDASETSECKVNNKRNDIDMQTNEATTAQSNTTKPSKRSLGSLQRSGLEQEQDSGIETSGPSSDNNRSLPQHARVKSVEPLDISYCCTPASLKLKGMLITRLSEVVSSGRIQVVCSILVEYNCNLEDAGVKLTFCLFLSL